jgi:hypothetical protein
MTEDVEKIIRSEEYRGYDIRVVCERSPDEAGIGSWTVIHGIYDQPGEDGTLLSYTPMQDELIDDVNRVIALRFNQAKTLIESGVLGNEM